METIKGRVLSVDGTQGALRVLVEVESVACARCAAGRGCGAGLATGGGSAARRLVAGAEPGIVLRPGDAVVLGLARRRLLSAAVHAWGLPLAGALSAAVLAGLAGAGDGLAAVIALAGGGLGAVVARARVRSSECLGAMTPSVIGHLPAGRP